MRQCIYACLGGPPQDLPKHCHCNSLVLAELGRDRKSSCRSWGAGFGEVADTEPWKGLLNVPASLPTDQLLIALLAFNRLHVESDVASVYTVDWDRSNQMIGL